MSEIAMLTLTCQLVNRLFLKLPVTTGPKTRAEAARPWTHVLQDEGLRIGYDGEKEEFVIMDEAIENIDALGGPGGNGELPTETEPVTA